MYAYRVVRAYREFYRAARRAEALYARRRAAGEAWVVELWPLAAGSYALVFFVRGRMGPAKFRRTASAVLGSPTRFARSLRSIGLAEPGAGPSRRRAVFQQTLPPTPPAP